ncbi:MAG: response regulator transcription factor [Jatrophihabitans sp.]
MTTSPSSPADSCSPGILVADDDADIRDLAAVMLRRKGYEVTAVEDGTAAEAELVGAQRTGAPFAVAILDVSMPGLSGLEVCRRIKTAPSCMPTQVLLVTALAQDADVAEGFAAGADDYLTKPFSPRELVARVGALLSVQPVR